MSNISNQTRVSYFNRFSEQKKAVFSQIDILNQNKLQKGVLFVFFIKSRKNAALMNSFKDNNLLFLTKVFVLKTVGVKSIKNFD